MIQGYNQKRKYVKDILMSMTF